MMPLNDRLQKAYALQKVKDLLMEQNLQELAKAVEEKRAEMWNEFKDNRLYLWWSGTNGTYQVVKYYDTQFFTKWDASLVPEGDAVVPDQGDLLVLMTEEELNR